MNAVKVDEVTLIVKEKIAASTPAKRGNLITFETAPGDTKTYNLVIPNHDRLFDQGDESIFKIVGPNIEEHIMVNEKYRFAKGKDQVVRYFHVWHPSDDPDLGGAPGYKGKYEDIPGNSPPKIVVT